MNSEDELRELRLQVTRLRGELVASGRRRIAADQHAEGWRQTSLRLAHQLEDLRASRSWKITRPLRVLRRSRSSKAGT